MKVIISCRASAQFLSALPKANFCFYFPGNLVRESFAAREDYSKLSTDAKHLKDVTTKLVNLRLDHTEFTCLKALALFKPGKYLFLFWSDLFNF